MIFRPLFLSMVTILPLTVVASPVTLHKDMPYINARKLLLKQGWHPVNLHLHDDYAFLGVEHELHNKNFNEFDSCSIDYSNCVMRFKREKKCLTVYTFGEKIRYMKVVDWNNECPAVAAQPQAAASKK